MNRSASAFLAVLLGALAVGIAVVPFYVLANNDRHILATDLQSAKERAAKIEEEKQRLAAEANNRVKEANTEVDRAERIIAALKEDQRLMTTATALTSVGSRELVSWMPVVSIPQHVTLMVPKLSATVESDDGNALRVTTVPTSTDAYARGMLWLNIQPYSALKEQELLTSFTSSTEVAFVANGQLFVGKKGLSTDDGRTAYLLQFRKDGEKKSLIYLKSIPALGKTGAERVISTIAFE